MVLPGHIAGGYLATTLLLTLSHGTLTPDDMRAVLILGTLSGELPDIDLVFFYITQRFSTTHSKNNHRDYITHLPIVWLGISSLIMLGGYASGSAFLEYSGAALLCGSWSHFILDSIEFGIMWLWPYSRQRHALMHSIDPGITRYKNGTPFYYWEFVTRHYFKRTTFFVELIISIVALLVYMR